MQNHRRGARTRVPGPQCREHAQKQGCHLSNKQRGTGYRRNLPEPAGTCYTTQYDEQQSSNRVQTPPPAESSGGRLSQRKMCSMCSKGRCAACVAKEYVQHVQQWKMCSKGRCAAKRPMVIVRGNSVAPPCSKVGQRPRAELMGEHDVGRAVEPRGCSGR